MKAKTVKMCRSCTNTFVSSRKSAHYCTVCRTLSPKERYYQKNRDAVMAAAADWKKRNREKTLDSSRRRYLKRREHHLAVCRAWGERNSERRRDHRENRRARERAAFVEDVDRVVMWARDGGLCKICGIGVSLAEMELDHVIPLVRGGTHEYSNCQTSHMVCNRRKFTKEGVAA